MSLAPGDSCCIPSRLYDEKPVHRVLRHRVKEYGKLAVTAQKFHCETELSLHHLVRAGEVEGQCIAINCQRAVVLAGKAEFLNVVKACETVELVHVEPYGRWHGSINAMGQGKPSC